MQEYNTWAQLRISLPKRANSILGWIELGTPSGGRGYYHPTKGQHNTYTHHPDLQSHPNSVKNTYSTNKMCCVSLIFSKITFLQLARARSEILNCNHKAEYRNITHGYNHAHKWNFPVSVYCSVNEILSNMFHVSALAYLITGFLCSLLFFHCFASHEHEGVLRRERLRVHCIIAHAWGKYVRI